MAKTQQELFDAIVTHLFTQKKQAVDPTGDMCMYRGPKGLTCAVGSQIPKRLYAPAIEGVTPCQFLDPPQRFNEPAEKNAKRALLGKKLHKFFGADNIKLLERLQEAHDAHANWFEPNPTELRKRSTRNRSASELWHSLLLIAQGFKLKQDVLRTYRTTAVERPTT